MEDSLWCDRVGAMMPVVGSIKTTVEEGESVERGQEFGYFAFGSISKSKLVDLQIGRAHVWTPVTA